MKVIDGVEYLTSKEASSLIGISIPTLYKAINRGSIPVHNTNETGRVGRYLLAKSDVLDYVRRSRVALETKNSIQLKLSELKLLVDIAKTKFEISGDLNDKMEALKAELRLIRFQMDMDRNNGDESNVEQSEG